jgi:hypothetical protein
MVRVVCEDGSVFHEPPYTEEEEAELERRINNVVGIAIAPRPAAPRSTAPQSGPAAAGTAPPPPPEGTPSGSEHQ